ncbi:hypothetical protein HPB47_023262 [Ixodes persulcatus]|uniref:Uncharacterized protein n=1 Tax=Ixodes persulcatus TaxID=34615 RepID=A0AC60Q7F3_IXOPE|nr:hypothetical protein HPB47_023262 [Ixodes persulcatus]
MAVPDSAVAEKRRADYGTSSLYGHKAAISNPTSPMNPPSDERPTPPAVSQKDWSASTADSLLLGRSWNYGSPDYGYSRGPSQRAAPVRSPLSPVSQQLNNSHISTGSGGFYGLYGSPTLDGISPSFPQDSVSGRKHSTSFEHEQPVTSAALRQNSTGCDSSHSDAVDLTVTLHRQESGFGFRIVGGTEEGSQVSIGHIVPGGAADLDGRLQTGDEIVFVDSQNVLHASHHHVVQLMGSAALNGCVSLGLRRKARSLVDSPHRPNNCEVTYPYNVTVMRHENEGFGFVIISSVGKAGSTIGRIIENSPAERCGQLHVGDRILAVNGISILDMHHGEIVNLIKVSGLSVVLTIGPPLEFLCLGCPRPGNRSLAPYPFFRCRGSRLARPGRLSGKGEDVGAAVRGEPLDCGSTVGGEYHSVELQRGVRGFGFSIRGGREFHSMPLFVLRIADQGPAHLSGKLQVADQILEVNGIDTKNMTHANAINVIRQGATLCDCWSRGPARGPLPLSVVDSPQSLLHPNMSGILNGPLSQSSPRSSSLVNSPPQKDWYNWNMDT